MMAWPTGGALPTDATLLIGDGTGTFLRMAPGATPIQQSNLVLATSPPIAEMTAVASFGNEVYVGGDDLVAVYNASQRRWTGATTIFGVPSAMAATATDLWVATEEDGLYRILYQPEPLNNSRAARTHGGTPLWAWPLTRKTWC